MSMPSAQPPLFPCEWPLHQLPGLSARDQHLLHRVGITSSLQLWHLTHTQLTPATLAARLHIPQRQVQKWVSLADLARLPAVGCTYCGLLLHVGVQSVQQLSQSSPEQLHPYLLRLQVQMTRQRDRCPAPSLVTLWIQEARQLQAQTQSVSQPGKDPLELH